LVGGKRETDTRRRIILQDLVVMRGRERALVGEVDAFRKTYCREVRGMEKDERANISREYGAG